MSLDLPVCACILVRGFTKEGEPAIRPYTPTSPNDTKGCFDLMVKIYEQGVVSQWLNNLEVGAMVGFKHIKFNIKSQYPFEGKQKINMICGGTGITPMYQALHKIVNTPGDSLQVRLLCGNKSPADILLSKELEELVEKAGGRVQVIHVVGTRIDQPDIPGWSGGEFMVCASEGLSGRWGRESLRGIGDVHRVCGAACFGLFVWTRRVSDKVHHVGRGQSAGGWTKKR